MKLKSILDFLCEIAPTETALEFDNVGLLVGDNNADITSCVIALDCTQKTVDTAIEKGAQLIITHHPVIFSPLKKVLKGDVVYRLIENGISVISMHTNLDIAQKGVNAALLNVLELDNAKFINCEDGFVFPIAELKTELSADNFAKYVKEKLNTSVKYSGNNSVKRVAVCSGSGADFLFLAKENGADALVTSECKHHLFNAAAQMGVTLVDGGHFNTEDVVIEPLCKILKEKFATINFITEHFTYIKTC